jgi:phosphatidylinositol glycan class P protein
MTSAAIIQPEHSPAPTPIRAVYGFVLFLLGTSTLILYFAWALLPEALLDTLGLSFLPQKYWAVAIPIYAGVVFVTFVTVVYPSLGMCITPTHDDIRNVIDEYSIYKHSTQLDNPKAVPVVSDLSLEETLVLVKKDNSK